MSLSSGLFAGGVVFVNHPVELLDFLGVVLVMRSERESVRDKRAKKGALQKYCCYYNMPMEYGSGMWLHDEKCKANQRGKLR